MHTLFPVPGFYSVPAQCFTGAISSCCWKGHLVPAADAELPLPYPLYLMQAGPLGQFLEEGGAEELEQMTRELEEWWVALAWPAAAALHVPVSSALSCQTIDAGKGCGRASALA